MNIVGQWVESYEDANSITLNGVTAHITKNSNTRNERVILFGGIYGNGSNNRFFGHGKYARCKIWDGNDNVKFDGYPALRLSDSKPGLYDLAGGIFYTNAGSGDFLYG